MKSITVEFQRYGDAIGILRRSDVYLRTRGLTTEVEEVSPPLDQERLELAMNALDYGHFDSADSDEEVAEIKDVADDVVEQLKTKLAEFLPLDAPTGYTPGELFQIDIVVHARELAQLPFEALESVVPDAVITRRIRQPWSGPKAVELAATGSSKPVMAPRVLFAWSNAAGDVPAGRHRQLLDQTLADWAGPAGPAYVELEGATLDDLRTALAGDHGFTHVHLLAHGLGAPPGATNDRIDLDAALVPQIFIGLDDGDGGLARVSPDELGGAFADADLQPGSVTLACCHSGEVGSAYSGGTFAHVLHQGGVPVVLASQLALTKAGSDLMIDVFLRQVIEGVDPREALRETRDRLRESDSTTFYDGTAVVGYINLNQNFEADLDTRKLVLALQRLKAASKQAERRAGLVSYDEAHDLFGRFDAIRQRLDTLAGGELTTKQLEELRGLQASSHKREAQAAWTLSRQPTLDRAEVEQLKAHSRRSLNAAREAYELAAGLSLDLHWVSVQWLALEAIVKGQHGIDAADWIISERAATRDLKGNPIWARGSLVELYLMASAMPSLGLDAALSTAETKLDEMVDLCVEGDDRFPFESMRTQLDRYVTWWGADDKLSLDPDLAQRAAGLRDRMDARWPASESGEPAGSAPVEAAAAPRTIIGASPPAEAQATLAESSAKAPIFQIDMLPANEGDALWIEYGMPRGPRHHVLVDCGRKTAYRSVVDRLKANDDLRLDLFVLTHVDADHIAGAVPLFQDPHFGPERVDDVWFNGWRHLNGLHKDADLDQATAAPSVLGAKQGEYFGAVLRAADYPWNEEFGGEAVAVGDLDGTASTLRTVELPGGMKLTLLGPTVRKLDDMANRWKKDLGKLPSGKKMEPGDWERALELLGGDRAHGPDTLRGDKPEGPLVMNDLLEVEFTPDGSEPNGSSIALLAEFGGKSVLLAGDAHAPELAKAIGRLIPVGETRLTIDAYKMSHHGSRRNNSPELLGLLDCKRFLVSTNGAGHYHPDREAIARVLHAQGAGVAFEFNYRSEFTEIWDDPALKAGFKYKTIYPADGVDGLRVVL